MLSEEPPQTATESGKKPERKEKEMSGKKEKEHRVQPTPPATAHRLADWQTSMQMSLERYVVQPHHPGYI